MPDALPVADAARTVEDVGAWERFRRVVVAVWPTVVGAAPEEQVLRRFLRVVEVQRLDLENGSGADRIQAAAWLDHAGANEATFELLTEIGLRAARERAWYLRHELQARAGVPVEVERGRPNHPRGRVSMRWLRERLDAAIEDLGPRYNCELTVEVPPAAVIAAFARRREALAPFRDELDAARSALLKAAEVDDLEPLPELIAEMEHLSANVEESGRGGTLPVERWGERIAAVLAPVQEMTKGYPSHQRESNPFAGPLESCWLSLERASAWLEGQVPAAWNERVVLLEGEQGRGKSHLLADTARAAINDGQPVLLLLGQHFLSPSEPRSQAVGNLQWPGTVDELLTALNSLAVGAGRRALLMIDALNEGEGRVIWPRWLAGFLQQVDQFEHIGVVLSVRTIALPVCVPDSVTKSVMRVEHTGFANVEFDAVREFFAHYGLIAPATPLLLPEFREPLFLDLFCRTAQQRPGMMLESTPGLSAVLDGFLATRDTIVSERLDLDPDDKVVTTASLALARSMAEQGRRWLSTTEAKRITEEVCPTTNGYSRSLYAALLTERVLINSFVHSQHGTADHNPIQFSYERLADHLVATNLIASARSTSGHDRDKLADAIAQLDTRDTTFDALALLLPELTGSELIDLADNSEPEFRETMAGRVVTSLPLRAGNAITDAAAALLTDRLLGQDRRNARSAAHVAVSLACRPGHRIDHDWLHATLAAMPMWQRDITWTAATAELSRRPTPYRRILTWIETEDAATIAALTDKAALAAAVTLMWAFTNSDRVLRDTATRRLVKLAEVHPNVLVPLLQRAIEIDDLYVLERVCAATYGVALRTLPDGELSLVADAVLNTVFRDTAPPAHILIRDYAHNTIRLAHARGLVTDKDYARTTGPWPSRWPEEDIPAQDELERRFPLFAEGEPSRDGSLWASIHLSAGEHGDFGIYIIGTNNPLSFPFASNSENVSTEDEPEPSLGLLEHLPEDNPLREAVDDLIAAAASTAAEQPARQRTTPVDAALVTRYVVCGVAERGWTPERFRDIDRELEGNHRAGRSPHKRERIGKKYQWQAWHEALALLADTHQPNDDSFYGRVTPTRSAAARDIDPTHQLTGNPEDSKPDQYSPANTWWMPYSRPHPPDLTAFDAQCAWVSDRTQLIDTTGLIVVPGAIAAASPAGAAYGLDDQDSWILLRGSASWYWNAYGPAPGLTSEGVWADHGLVHHTVFIRQADIPTILAAPLNDYRPHDYQHDFIDGAFLGEFPHHPNFLDILAERETADGWTTETSIPASVLHASDRYVWEGSNYDCSLTGTVSVTLPSAHFLHLLSSDSHILDGAVRQSDGTVIAFAPDTYEPGDSTLLIRGDLLHAGLADADLALGRLVYQERRSAKAHEHDPWPGMITRTTLHIHVPTAEGWTTLDPRHRDVEHPARPPRR
ncbi:hypothetical protein [Amycolatopsis sp. NPDC003731]